MRLAKGGRLAGKDFEGEGAAPALLLHEGEPEGQERVDNADLIGVAQADGAQANVGNELIDDLAGVVIGAAVEEVGLDAIEDGVIEVFPAKNVEGAIDLGVGGLRLEGGEAVERAASSNAIGGVDDDFAIKGGGVGGDGFVHCCAGDGE